MTGTSLPVAKVQTSGRSNLHTRNAHDVLTWLKDRFELYRGLAQNVRAMEGLRGFAVILVFFVHYVSQIKVYIPAHSLTSDIATPVGVMGNAGVDLFFVLSGYLIYGKLISRPQPLGPYVRRRLERIYPTFIAVFAIYLLFSFLRPADDKIPHGFGSGLWYLIANFLLLPGLFPVGNLITQAWSLSYEIFFYLAIPIIVVLTGMRAWSPRLRIAVFAALAIGFTVYCSTEGGHIRLIMFVAGIILFETVRHRLIPQIPAFIASAASVAGLAFLLAPLNGAAGYSLRICGLFVAFFILCHVAFTQPRAFLTRRLSWTPLRWFGNMSYSYYLMHGLALKALFIGLAVLIPVSEHQAVLAWVLLPVAFAFSIIPSALLYLIVERPLSLSPALEKRAERETGETPAPPEYSATEPGRGDCC